MMHHADVRNPQAELIIRRGTLLPHGTMIDAIYDVTFRLADALPASVLNDWRSERRDIANLPRILNRSRSNLEMERATFLSSSKVEAALDTGFGACWMRDDRIAELVANALGHFDGVKYRLFAWCVMPNHVHVVIQPLEEYELPKIVHSWKSFTSNRVNKILNRSGEFWHREYYDHLIRNEHDLIRTTEYVIGNPDKAELQDWEWTGFGDGWLQYSLSQAGATRM